MRELRSLSRTLIDDAVFCEKFYFQNGQLPLEKDVIEMMLFQLSPIRAGKTQRSKDDAASVIAHGLIDHWIHCNLYTLSHISVKKKIVKLFDEFRSIQHARCKNENWIQKKAKPFNERVASTLFDIIVKDDGSRKRQEDFYGVSMTSSEQEFYEDQKKDRLMYNEMQVDRKWEKMVTKRKKREDGLKRLFEREKESQQNPKVLLIETDIIESDNNDAETEETNNNDPAFSMPDSVHETTPQSKRKRKRVFTPEIKADQDDNLPYEYRHIRQGERRVKEKYYRVVDKLISTYHMSINQATAAVVEVGNYMFGRKWKFHTEEEDITLDTVPDRATSRRVGKALEAFTLATIASKIIETDDTSCVTYHDDGSRKQGVGSYSVQGVTINDEYFAFPTLKICSETRQNLADLKITVLNLLAVCEGYETGDLWNKVDFLMVYSTLLHTTWRLKLFACETPFFARA